MIVDIYIENRRDLSVKYEKQVALPTQQGISHEALKELQHAINELMIAPIGYDWKVRIEPR